MTVVVEPLRTFDRTIEIGHVYAPDRLVPMYEPMEFEDTPHARTLRSVAALMGKESLVVALVDDVVARESQRNSSDTARWQRFINASVRSAEVGSGASYIQLESQLVDRGEEIIEHIQAADLPHMHRLSQDGTKLIVGSGKDRMRIPLRGFQGVEDPQHPSCAVLDAAWLEKRLEMAKEVVTVLPISYFQQQRQVAVLTRLRKVSPESGVVSIFTNDQGNQVTRVRWF